MEKRRSVKRFERVDLICDECGSIVEHSGRACVHVGGALKEWVYVCPACHKEYKVPIHKNYPYFDAVPEDVAGDVRLYRVDFDRPDDGELDTIHVVDCSPHHAKIRVKKQYKLGDEAFCFATELSKVDGFAIKLVKE